MLFPIRLAIAPADPSPIDFTAAGLSIVSIGLSWSVSDFNCDVYGYRILIVDGLQTTTVDIEDGNRDSYVVNDLSIGTEYGFRIFCTYPRWTTSLE